ncbi:AVAST type 1 anti-phage system protein Avs1c [Clostridium beijerinckii]|uniref:Uncharacterized protein n=1 Tax=Clostridium beijerinckii TaxID=1520 RepID=A0A9Q5GAU2_CLOBE|nr:AVAST type 1 anti-phage system protein Avs1c [Clostridium beijerinckii]AQS04505.1 hypothetical protein CLBIJ_19270 [Clostridium beijerinckii]MBA2887355.1 hypothetical protein [Clostridium beijerinckii]MBA2902248.1 hypothetical protein [Clostridium beijerinckii]MBA2912071.1 hypothetical protein [Clostridium beijerinckii]MBA9015940.1 hypothetical protein [Clostridium beijerinckii]
MEDLTREDFERNMNILVETMEQGKLIFPQGFSGDSLLRVRKAPNGRIDFLTVDEGARLNANMMAWTNDDFFEELNASVEADNNDNE